MPSSLVSVSPSPFRGEFGLAQADITPPVGIYARNWGAAKHDVAQSIHRPLLLNVLVVRSLDGKAGPLVLVDGDLGWWRPLTVFHTIQARVMAEFSLQNSQFLFGLSHTHAGPPLSLADPEWMGGELLEPWLEQVFQATVSTISNAFKSARPALLDWHWGRCGLAAARDLQDPSSPRKVCGYDPSIKADDTLLVGRVTDEQGGTLATLVNYACHPTTLAWSNQAISPDFVGSMRQLVTDSTGGAPTFFLQGASGELAPRYQYVGDTAVADRHGRQLGHAVLATLEDMEAPGQRLRFDGVVESGAPLAIWRPETVEASRQIESYCGKVDLSLKDWGTVDELERQRQECTDRALAERLRRRRDIRKAVGDGDTFPLPLHLWQMGDAFLVGTMAEAYSILQIELRRRFPDRHIVCMNLVNGSVGYLAPAEMYDVDLYQVWQSPFDRGGLEQTIEALSDMIQARIDGSLP